jgi:glycosyltransferase involved in cell wall biosynthesis
MDATPLSVKTGGVRRYTAELACTLARMYQHDAYYLVSDQRFDSPAVFPNLIKCLPPRGALTRRWWTVGLARELRRLEADVFHGTDFAVPYLPLRPTVVTVHDCTPWRVESRSGTSLRVQRRTPALLRFGLATMIITPSEAVRREVIERFGISPARIVATPLAAASHFRPVVAARRERPYFLYVGAAGPRKNVSMIEDAARELGVELLMPARVGFVAEDELPALYCGAAAVLYPSLYEGFGLPVLEAMQCGAVVIASKDAAITEVAGGAIVQADATDRGAWVAAMRSALAGEGREELRAKALARAAAFSWDRTAALTREVYDEARRIF